MDSGTVASGIVGVTAVFCAVGFWVDSRSCSARLWRVGGVVGLLMYGALAAWSFLIN